MKELECTKFEKLYVQSANIKYVAAVEYQKKEEMKRSLLKSTANSFTSSKAIYVLCTLLDIDNLPEATPLSTYPARKKGNRVIYEAGRKLYFGEVQKLLKRVSEKRGIAGNSVLNSTKIWNAGT